MKNILVLTDFSDNANNAAKSAVSLAARIHANIVLYNSYSNLPVMPTYGSGPWVPEDLTVWAEESKKDLKKLVSELEDTPIETGADQRRPTIHSICGEGNLGPNVARIIEQENIELVIMGASNKNTVEHFLYGRETQSVLQKATRPVLIIPAKNTFTDIKRIVFATNYDEGDIKVIQYLTKLFSVFHFELEFVHVHLHHDQQEDDRKKEAAFIEKLSHLKFPGIANKEIRGKDLANRLNNFCKEGQSDLLALVQHHYPFLKSVFKQNTTKKVLENVQFPVLIFPVHFEN